MEKATHQRQERKQTRQKAAQARHDKFIGFILKGVSQVEAYRRVYPASVNYKYASLKQKASHLAGNLRATIEERRQKAITQDIMTARHLMEMHSRRAAEAFPGIGRVLTILPDGTKTIEITEENASIVQEATSRVETSGRGDGKQDACFIHVKVRDYLDYAKELAKLAGYYPPEKREHTGNMRITWVEEKRERKTDR